MPGNESRSAEEVERLIELAKLDAADLERSTQTLYVSSQLESGNVVLMEVNSTIMKELSDGKSLVLRGGNDDTTIMCSKDVTYEVREATTSNALLLVPGLQLPMGPNEATNSKDTLRALIPKHICGIHRAYLEPRECQPKLQKLRKMLEKNPYAGPEFEVDNDKPNYSMEDLLDQVQATESQILKGLACIPAYNIGGFFRALDFDYHWRILNFILDLVSSNSWPMNEIPRTETVSTLEELVPRQILEQCFDEFCQMVENQNADLYELKEDRICRFHAEVLLRNAGKFHREEFLKVWQASVPEGMTTNLDYLKGIVIEDCTSKPEVIFFYPVWQLPEHIPNRLDSLFSVKEKWTYNEIEPYIQDLSSNSMSVSALLTKYTRSSTKNGIRYFNTKYPLKK